MGCDACGQADGQAEESLSLHRQLTAMYPGARVNASSVPLRAGKRRMSEQHERRTHGRVDRGEHREQPVAVNPVQHAAMVREDNVSGIRAERRVAQGKVVIDGVQALNRRYEIEVQDRSA